MLLLLPLVFFGLIGIALGVLRLRGMRMAYLWLLPAFIALVCWVVFIILPVPAVADIFIIPGLFSMATKSGLAFDFNEISWGFVFLVVSLVLVYFLTLLIRLEQEKRTLLWIGWLLLAMAAILSFTAGNLTTLITAWVLFDLLDFCFTYFILKTSEVENSLGNFLPSRVTSVVLLVLVRAFLQVESGQWLPAPLVAGAYILFFLAALFRSGLLPLKLENKASEDKGVSFSYLKRILMVLSSFSLLSFLPIRYLSNLSQILFSAIFLLISIFFLFLSLSRRMEDTDYWLNSIICLGCIAAISGTPISLLGWAGVALLGTSLPHFYTLHSRQLNSFAWLGVFSIGGLPYSVGALALAGLTSAISSVWLLLSLPVYALLLTDFIRIAQMPGEDKESSQPLFLAFYLFGLFLMALSPFAILIKSPTLAANVLQFWWPAVIILAFCLISYWLYKRIRISANILEVISKRVVTIIDFFTFDWLKGLWQWVAWFISGLTVFLSQLLDGEGGIIWAVVILALLVSLISVGRS